jgi:hypothetical protein
VPPPLSRRGRPSHKPEKFYASFRYRAGSWDQARRVVAKVEWHAGALFPRVGFLVTNLKWRAKKVVRFYNRRGTAEQWIKEGKSAGKGTRLSCRRFQDNAARLQLFALAYNLANFLRQLVLPRPIRGWTLTTLREKMVKIGAKVVRHAKYVVVQLAEVAVPAATVHPNPGADRPPAPDLCLGLRLSAPTTGSESPRRPSGVSSVGGFRVLSEGEASCAVSSGRDDAANGGAFGGKTVATVPACG